MFLQDHIPNQKALFSTERLGDFQIPRQFSLEVHIIMEATNW